MTPLHWAVERGHEECVLVLLNEGANPRAESKFLKTPLSIAAEMGWDTMVEVLQSNTTREATMSIQDMTQGRLTNQHSPRETWRHRCSLPQKWVGTPWWRCCSPTPPGKPLWAYRIWHNIATANFTLIRFFCLLIISDLCSVMVLYRKLYKMEKCKISTWMVVSDTESIYHCVMKENVAMNNFQ